jgi:AcrR family transcriptional regulator
MPTVYSGSGDPARSIALLWGLSTGRRRGPRPKLTVAEIVRAAVALADESGLDAVTMRRVADRIGGTTAMSLYTYVPRKSELLDLMLDAVHGEPVEPVTTPGDDWRTRLAAVARQRRARYLRHPWLLQVAGNRPVLGPHVTAAYDHELAAVAGIGLSDVEMDLVVTMVSDYVHGAVRGEINSTLIARHSGVTDQQWWDARAPLLRQVLDPDRFPLASRVGAAAGAEYGAAGDPARAFAFGLERLLDGVAVLVASRQDG